MTGRLRPRVVDFAILTLSLLPLAFGMALITHNVKACNKEILSTSAISASIHIETSCAFNFLNVAGGSRHGLLVDVSQISFSIAPVSGSNNKTKLTNNRPQDALDYVKQAMTYCLKFTWVENVYFFSATRKDFKELHRVDHVSCSHQIPPTENIYMLIEDAEGVIIEPLAGAKNFTMDLQITSVYIKYSFEECPAGFNICQEDRRVCIPEVLVCDGFKHCPEGTDEERCTSTLLGRFRFDKKYLLYLFEMPVYFMAFFGYYFACFNV